MPQNVSEIETWIDDTPFKRTELTEETVYTEKRRTGGHLFRESNLISVSPLLGVNPVRSVPSVACTDVLREIR